MRHESEIFTDLERLCRSPGFAHAVAFFCLRDNLILYQGEMTPDDMDHMYTLTRLVRTEISTLIGLMAKGEIDFESPGLATVQSYVSLTESLLNELHHALGASLFKEGDTGEALREPIFYGGESAYSFQYRDFSVPRYEKDIDWLKQNKGFSIEQARAILIAIGKVQDEKLAVNVPAMLARPELVHTLLQGFSLEIGELVSASGLDTPTVEAVVRAFSFPSAG